MALRFLGQDPDSGPNASSAVWEDVVQFFLEIAASGSANA
jgi:hypothetical protein